MAEKILEVIDLKKYYPIKKGFFSKTVKNVKAVDGVSFTLNANETLGIVGESGCGKSTTGKLIMQSISPTSGQVIFDGEDLGKLTQKQLRASREKFQMIFQDPYASLNPKMTVYDIVAEPFVINKVGTKQEIEEKVCELLKVVGIPLEYRSRYPHEFSGGQRQRIGIARAIALQPKLIVADEAVSALDVSVQAQILNLLEELKKKYQLSFIFISHNLAVVRHISDRIGVMYLGNLVELATNERLYENPLHPYTKALLSAALEPKRGSKRERIILEGDIPSPAKPPSGCPFHTRCPEAIECCASIKPELIEVNPGQKVACHLYSNDK